ncbi:hypothetical protein TanjilG_15541 [Lupinus angustifolius]|uniref:uncharacterized protein LOC109335425 n=1 Tax=Lupinus angustifolius TaxID=3871 RepID=UPI00090E652D|nr:PREDICTED: uncharacterized protein LOC109335425 [Lupinus angustifolius]XP_019427106.1 PREDICTED: uncharacterized protein LOC109335426 [Lupinus angustifolius]OIV90807.1 hypothetical protein TanjilG_15540 [Lupinus angustifolius]OIV90808.1 hypothetical protein TanjilG_15541 [Lupinus angustifolius]
MIRTFLIARLTASSFTQRSRTQIQLGSLLPYNAFIFFKSFTSGTSLKSESQTNHHKFHNFTVSYLINSCGLSPDLALKISKKIKLKNQDGPDVVLDLLKNYGFSEKQLSILIKRLPSVLLAEPDKTLLPKLKFFQSIGMSEIDLPRIIIGNCSLLTLGLKNNIIPRYNIIRSLLRSDEEVVSTLKHGPRYFHGYEVINDSVQNIEVLRRLGLPQGSISLLVTNFPSVVFMKHSRFNEAVEATKEMGFDPMKTNFVLALQVLAKMDKAMWKAKLEAFQRWGWSKDICLVAFKKYPQYMMIAEKKIMKTLSFLVENMGCSLEDIARCPGILNRNLEKTFIPRCAVVKVLKSSGLVKNDLHIGTFMILSEKKFLEKYVTRFQKIVPLLLDVYEGKKVGLII